MPMMKSSPGEVRVQSVKDVLPLPEEIAKFPGPLRAKSKKKDVSAWLGRNIESMENQLKSPISSADTSSPDVKRLEEKVLLWKILQVFIDNDGHLEGNVSAETAVRKILAPQDDDSNADPNASFATAADLIGITRSNTTTQAELTDPKAVEEIRLALTRGDREKA